MLFGLKDYTVNVQAITRQKKGKSYDFCLWKICDRKYSRICDKYPDTIKK